MHPYLLMKLTSYDRMIRYLAANNDGNLTNNVYHKRDILLFIDSYSRVIEHYLNRKIEISSYTEYKPVRKTIQEYRMNCTPISSISSVKYDINGVFTGDETTLDTDEYYISPELNTVVLNIIPNFKQARGLQIMYTGGLAYSATQSIFTVSSVSGFTVGNYIIGNDSYSCGIIKSIDTENTRLTVEILYGTFITEETITESTDEDIGNTTSNTATIESKYRTALCESNYSGIVTACEMEVRYAYRHKLDFENLDTDRDGVTHRRVSVFPTNGILLQQETQNILMPYRRVM